MMMTETQWLNSCTKLGRTTKRNGMKTHKNSLCLIPPYIYIDLFVIVFVDCGQSKSGRRKLWADFWVGHEFGDTVLIDMVHIFLCFL